jgi:hypothetical protein
MKRIPKVAYTLEFKLEALRRVRGGEPVRQVGREIGVPEQSIRNWAKADAEGKLGTTHGQRQADNAGTDGDLATAGGECTAADGDRDLKKPPSWRRPGPVTRNTITQIAAANIAVTTFRSSSPNTECWRR